MAYFVVWFPFAARISEFKKIGNLRRLSFFFFWNSSFYDTSSFILLKYYVVFTSNFEYLLLFFPRVNVLFLL